MLCVLNCCTVALQQLCYYLSSGRALHNNWGGKKAGILKRDLHQHHQQQKQKGEEEERPRFGYGIRQCVQIIRGDNGIVFLDFHVTGESWEADRRADVRMDSRSEEDIKQRKSEDTFGVEKITVN